MKKEKKISEKQFSDLFETLKTRFEKNPGRHRTIKWSTIEKRLVNPHKRFSLFEMERTGGEPDVIGLDKETGAAIFCDCSPESPAGRRSLCYDEQALRERKEAKPASSALQVAHEMGISLLDEDQYRTLQQLGPFDQKTSSWLLTPQSIRDYGGAIFGDFRYGRTFVYHNGAQSYYAARGFRGYVSV